MLTGKILKKHFENEEIISLVEATLVAEAHAELMRERVNEYSEPVWKNHWQENKQKYLDALEEKETKRDKNWFLDGLTDECLENDWKEHQSKASLLVIDETYYEKIAQAHIDNNNRPLYEGDCPALEAESTLRECKVALFLSALDIFSKIPELEVLADKNSHVWWSQCKAPKPSNYKGTLWTNQDYIVHTLIENIVKSKKLTSKDTLSKYL